ncbi:peroxisomal N(1)-acetyl-spermine/spermidine oxidase isoform X3 [Echeneis naucrates]|uniref:peroxisomal N(1)-acetyl-spermine/spermidine oxidase isoform X3 n=1 Tax=Echeneis naucrates TaxID=173247 RepID=UPI0011135D83|nr:peroxisomal N(1)-acetyl-spermine/spermidine oxidase isoform X3 [Echeneis naucrates]
MNINSNIVIIGCGMSGIAAAHRLIGAGFNNVRILEATGRSGGRIKTGKLGNSIVEIGANWIHGPSEGNPVFCLARQYGLLDPEALTPENQAVDVAGHPPWVPNIFSSSGRRLKAETLRPAVEVFFELMQESSEFHSKGGEPCASVGDFIRSKLQQRVAEIWKDVDANTRTLQMGAISSMLKVECSVNGYLKKHHTTLFHPPLPLHKLHSIQRQGFGTNNKIFVEFDSPWWDADCEVIYLVWEDEDAIVDQEPDVQRPWIKKLFGFTVLKPTERYGHILCGWIAGHESEYMETLSEQEVMFAVTQLIRRFTGNPSITPRRIVRSQWFHDPWTCGSYSYPGKQCSMQDLENMMEPLPVKGLQSRPLQVLFAGEATHPSYYSTVHGALLSGWREADRLISHYSSISPSQLAKAKL